LFEEFAYFTIRVRLATPDDSPPTISGIIEDLATGEKHEFGSSAELLRVVHTRGRGDAPATTPHQ
jgi:hypothetical protein